MGKQLYSSSRTYATISNDQSWYAIPPLPNLRPNYPNLRSHAEQSNGCFNTKSKL